MILIEYEYIKVLYLGILRQIGIKLLDADDPIMVDIKESELFHVGRVT